MNVEEQFKNSMEELKNIASNIAYNSILIELCSRSLETINCEGYGGCYLSLETTKTNIPKLLYELGNLGFTIYEVENMVTFNNVKIFIVFWDYNLPFISYLLQIKLLKE